jgi:hypothetical protein
MGGGCSFDGARFTCLQNFSLPEQLGTQKRKQKKKKNSYQLEKKKKMYHHLKDYYSQKKFALTKGYI